MERKNKNLFKKSALIALLLTCMYCTAWNLRKNTRCDPKVLRRVVLKEFCALHLAADTITT
jgi:hypothetical protein